MIRMSALTITGLKNIQQGRIEFPEDSGVLTLYGQNGSGKSAVIDALEILKILLSGEVLSPFYADLVSRETGMMRLGLHLETDFGPVSYHVRIRNEKNLPVLCEERLVTEVDGKRREKERRLSAHRSALFRDASYQQDRRIRTLGLYAREGLIISRSDHFSEIRFLVDGKMRRFPLDRRFRVSEKEKKLLEKKLEAVSTVLAQMIPGLEVRLSCERQEGYFVSVRDGVRVPMRFESVGIKKLFSLLPDLIDCFSRDDVLLACDEMDYAISEYLFGQIIQAMEEFAEGQLLLTSHNLRALEVLEVPDVVFATSDRENRFKTMSFSEDGTPARSSYLRKLALGESGLYARTSTLQITQALFEAGNMEDGGWA